jgi:hypothetical protein
MERFKVCEKEAKVKAFSRAGLGQQDRLDPEEQAKAEAREWINETVTRLQEQVRDGQVPCRGALLGCGSAWSARRRVAKFTLRPAAQRSGPLATGVGPPAAACRLKLGARCASSPTAARRRRLRKQRRGVIVLEAAQYEGRRPPVRRQETSARSLHRP